MKPIFLTTITYNRVEHFKAHLPCVENSDHNLFDWVIVDNNSQDDTRKILEELKFKYKDNIQIFILGENVGHPQGYNFALTKRGMGQHWVQIEQDILVKDDKWLDSMYHAIENIPDIGVIGLKTKGRYFANFSYRAVDNIEDYERVEYVIGECIMAKSDVLDQVGYYETCYGKWGYADISLMVRIKKLGYKIAFYPNGTLQWTDVPGRLPYINITHLEDIIPNKDEYQSLKPVLRHNFGPMYENNKIAILDGVYPTYWDTDMVNYTNFEEL